jgi:DeoR/GlpR family transcriptional regulator of sugar metabolism
LGKKEERENAIYSLLIEKNSISISEAVEYLGVSDSTIRRLFRELEYKGKALRILGGLHQRNSEIIEYSFDTLEQKNVAEKRRIGEYAANLVNPGDIIFLDGGTTLLHVSIYLLEKMKSGKLYDNTILTNSLVILDRLAQSCKVLLVGGAYRLRRKDFAGLISERVVKSLRFSKCFLGADGVDVEEGFMAMDSETASLDEIIISRSEKSYILVDSTKFQSTSLISYGELEKATMIITDSNLEPSIVTEMRQRNIPLALV